MPIAAVLGYPVAGISPTWGTSRRSFGDKRSNRHRKCHAPANAGRMGSTEDGDGDGDGWTDGMFTPIRQGDKGTAYLLQQFLGAYAVVHC